MESVSLVMKILTTIASNTPVKIADDQKIRLWGTWTFCWT